MRDQTDLLRDVPWDVLVVLDACRADAFHNVTGVGECVHSPAQCTQRWIKAVAPLLRRPIYFNANPVVTRENQREKLGLTTLNLWESLWGNFTHLSIPSVHPMSVTSAVWTWLTCRPAAKGSRLVVHYLQPHSPFIGNPPLKLTRWGRGMHPFVIECHDLKRPEKAIRDGTVSWPDVREAYIGNLRLAWESVNILFKVLKGRRIVVTSDHGELLGEEGRFGHECNWTNRELFEVPWLEVTRTKEVESTEEKLKALGYV